MSNVIGDFRLYQDKYGLNQIETNGMLGITTQNGVMFTVEYINCLLGHPDVSYNDILNEIVRVNSVLSTCEPKPGLTVRFPNSEEFDSKDNTAAALVFSARFGDRKFAQRMRNHGLQIKEDGWDSTQDPKRNKLFFWIAKLLGFGHIHNFWNNQHPSKFCFFGWFGVDPAFMGLLDICATGNTTPFRKFALLVGQLIPAIQQKPEELDLWKISYLAWSILTPRHQIWRKAFKWWYKRLKEIHPDGMKGIYSIYYRDPHHPVAKYTNV